MIEHLYRSDKQDFPGEMGAALCYHHRHGCDDTGAKLAMIGNIEPTPHPNCLGIQDHRCALIQRFATPNIDSIGYQVNSNRSTLDRLYGYP